MRDPPAVKNEFPIQPLRPMENYNEAHSAPVKIETLDEPLSECQAAPPSPQLAFYWVVPESGCGNLDLPPSPPPLPLVSESMAPEIHNELSIEVSPPVYQITDKPPLKNLRNMHQKLDQSIEACKIEVETVPLVSGTVETDPNGEEQMEAQPMDINCSGAEVLDRSPSQMAPQGSVSRNLVTQASSGSDTIASTGHRGMITQDTPSGPGETAAASALGDFRHIKLKKLFQRQAQVERYTVTKNLLSCKLAEGDSVSAHMLKMLSYVQQLEMLDAPVSNELATNVIFNSLPASYSWFILNYHMLGMDMSLDELHEMLKTTEVDMTKGDSHVLTINSCSRKVGKGKKKGKGKNRKDEGNAKGKWKAPVETASTPKAKPYADAECFYCKAKGHWKRNCCKYLADLKSGAMTSGSKEVCEELAMDVVFNTMSASYSGFMMNYHMHGTNKSPDERHGILKTTEIDMKKGGSHVLAINSCSKKVGKCKKKGKGNAKGKEKAHVETASTPKAKPYADAECFYCKVKEHWKRNCHKYLTDLKSEATISALQVMS